MTKFVGLRFEIFQSRVSETGFSETCFWGVRPLGHEHINIRKITKSNP